MKKDIPVRTLKFLRLFFQKWGKYVAQNLYFLTLMDQNAKVLPSNVTSGLK